MRCLVAGAGGFIGGHLVKRLLNDGHEVRAVDKKVHGEKYNQWWQLDSRAENLGYTDLRFYQQCQRVCVNIDRVYNLACNMGGIGFIESNKCNCMESVLINTNLLRSAKEDKVGRYFYSSSACVYHADRQNGPAAGAALKEDDAYYNNGAMPEDGYGWEKLFSERMCRHFREDYGLETRVARFHNIYGPHGSWNDGREKAPAAMCRKIAEAKANQRQTIDVWGDGTITRSFCYVDDCVEGILRLTESDHHEPINVGSDELVTVNELISVVQRVANVNDVHRKYDTTKPQGVQGRNSDNTKIKEVLGWAPSTSLVDGIAKTYPWIEEQVNG